MRFLRGWTLLLGLATAFPALAAERTVGTVKINLVAPTGQCEVTGVTPHEAEVIKKMRELLLASKITILAMYAECNQLAAARKVPTALKDFSQYVIQTALIDQFPPERFVFDVCEVQKKITTSTVEDIAKIVQPKAKDVGLNIKMEQAHYLGVLAEDANTCYAGNVQAVAGNLQVNVTTNVLVKGKFITYQTYAPYRGTHSADELLARHKDNVAAFIAANN